MHALRTRPSLPARANASAGSACTRISAAGLRWPQQQQQEQQEQRRRRRQQGGRASASASPGDGGGEGPGPSSSAGDDDLARLLKADMERFAGAAAASSASSSTTPGSRQQGAAGSGSGVGGGGGGGGGAQEPEGGVKAALDKLLVADFFAVLAALGWLGAGLAERAALGSSRLVDAWMPLWPLLWQPLIGVLMAGALVSGGAGWVAGKAREREEEQEQARQRRR